MVGYSGTPLLKKMGIKQGMRGVFVGAPNEALDLFRSVPFCDEKELSGEFDYIHVFANSETGLRTDFSRAKNCLRSDGLLWVSWPKSGKLGTDLSENKVREIGLAYGLVDVKVAAIDDVWSGLKFVFRLKDRHSLREKGSQT